MNRFKRTLKFQQKLLMFNSYICASFYGSVHSNVYVPLLIDIRTENKSVKGRIVRKAIAEETVFFLIIIVFLIILLIIISLQ